MNSKSKRTPASFACSKCNTTWLWNGRELSVKWGPRGKACDGSMRPVEADVRRIVREELAKGERG